MISPKTGPTISAMPPRMTRKNAAAASAPPRPINSRAATSATPAAPAIMNGSSTRRNCGTSKSNSPWKTDRPSSRPPIAEAWRTKRAIRPTLRSPSSVDSPPWPSCSSTSRPTSERPAPPMSMRWVGPAERHVLAEQPVPDVVEREAEQRVEAGGGEQDAADRHVPALDEAHGGRARLLVQRHRAGEDAAGEDAEQPEQDEEVGRVGQRALVAADADVQADVPEHAEQRGEQRQRREDRRQRDPGRHAGARCRVASPIRVSTVVRRVRCRNTRPSRTAVRPRPSAVARITSPIAAPPAGRVSAASSTGPPQVDVAYATLIDGDIDN